jgi:[acyl-carrier-protein] S-malonyltransferase
MSIAFVFPGQGSQAVGMGRSLADNFASARAVFDEVDAALSQKLSDLMWNGPEDQLTLTENAQPALMAVSLAAMRMLEVEHGITVANTASCVAGHSLGEYSALAAAGTFTLADTARLLKIRGRAMQLATPVGTGAMAALLGLDFATASLVAAEAAQGDVCQAANDNSDGQVVISGHRLAVERALDIAKSKGAKRAILLPVSAPFHCALMQPAAEAMAEALAGAEMQDPVVPVIANVVAGALTDAAEIRQRLVDQVTGTVRWRECVYAMNDRGVDVFVEVGSGKVLTGLAKKNAPEARAVAFGTADDVTGVLTVLRG